MPAVVDLTSLSKATVYRKINEGSFPPPLKIGKARVAWRQSDVALWLDQQARAYDLVAQNHSPRFTQSA
jgi:prophage regulatory protein